MALAQMAAVELAKRRIRVNAIRPGQIDAEIKDNTWPRDTEAAKVPAEYPAGEILLTGCTPGFPEEVTELVLFLASDRSRHITGSPVWTDGGQSLLVG